MPSNGIKITKRVSVITKNLKTVSQRKINQAIAKFTLDLVEATPVRTGLAHSNWRITIGKRTTKFRDYGEFGIDWSVKRGLMPEDHESFTKLQPTSTAMWHIRRDADKKFELGDTIFFQNNVPYMGYLKSSTDILENVEIAKLNFKSYLKNALKGIGGDS